MRAAGWALLGVAAVAAAQAQEDWGNVLWDRVELRDGRVLEGSVEDGPDGTLIVRLGLGKTRIPRGEVLRLERGHDPLEELARLEALGYPGGTLEQARAYVSFCEAFDLLPQARGAAERLLAADPEDALARRVLGFVRRDGAWVAGSVAWRARREALAAAKEAARVAERAARWEAIEAAWADVREPEPAPRALDATTTRVREPQPTVVVVPVTTCPPRRDRGWRDRDRRWRRDRDRDRRDRRDREREVRDPGPRKIHVRPLDEARLKRVKLDLK